MIIKRIKIQNFRNFQDVSISFDDKLNFIIGENNIGKSNFLDLLEIIFSPNKSFNEDDFNDTNNPIVCELTVSLDDIEIGLFDDLIDPSTGNTITLKFVQDDHEDILKCYFALNENSPQKIDKRKMKCINFVKYESVRIPERELKFERTRGPGRFLKHILTQTLREKGSSLEDYIKSSAIEGLRESIQGKLSKLRFFKNFGLTVGIPDDVEKLTSLLFTLEDDGRDMSFSGHGVQFTLTTILSILEKIVYSIEKHKDCTWTDNEHNKSISIILALDEPEAHLHPYMQRSLMKYIRAIVDNSEEGFKDLINELFGLDKILMQVFIVTHSPNILLDDYKQYIRFFFDSSGTLSIKSGSEISINNQREKHFYRNHLFVKEAFFSRCVILVEGDTELGAIPVWANNLLGDIDTYSISIIKVDGKYSLQPVRDVLNAFGIANIIIADSDKGETFAGEEYVFITHSRDFEEEVVNTLWKLDHSGKEIIFEILAEEGEYRDAKSHLQGRNNIIRTMEKGKMIEKFRNKKSYTFGQIVAEKITLEDYIPKVYKDAIYRAKELSGIGG